MALFRKKIHIRIGAILLAVLLGTVPCNYGSCSGLQKVHAAATSQKLTLKTAKQLAVMRSAGIEKLEMQLDTKKAALESAIKSIAVKKKNLSTFRWTPLLSFKFPSSPNQSQAYEFMYKPVSIQYEIDKINHSIADQRLTECEAVNELYVDIVVCEKNIQFSKDRIAILEENIKKNKAKLAVGEATQADIDKMQASLDKLNQSLGADERASLNSKKKLSNKIGIDVTDGWTFEDPFVSASLDRSMLQDLIDYTLKNDDTYYEVCVDAISAKTALQTNYGLIKNFYSSSYTSLISSYVDTVLGGGKVNAKSFKKQYKTFAESVNRPWNGSLKILFFKFSKNWFQGALDGDRYIEDNPYALYENTMAYQEARIAQEQAKEELTANVEQSFNNYVEVKNSYQDAAEKLEQAKTDLDKARILNRAGQLTYDEFSEEQSNYEEMQNDYLNTMKLYSKAVFGLDRLTCGGVTQYMGELNGDLSASSGGESYVTAEYANGANYYIRPIVQEEQFEVGVSIPDNFDVDISDYELWVDKVQIGNRTPINETIRHMSFVKDRTEEVFIRFYNGEDFVDDVVIDPSAFSGPLDIVSEYVQNQNGEKVIGTYELTSGAFSLMSTLTLKVDEAEGVAYYRLLDASGKYIGGETLRDSKKSFSYLSILEQSLETVEIEFYDKDQQLLYKGHFDTALFQLMQEREEP